MEKVKHFELYQPVVLTYDEEDLEPVDLGMSGIVLESPLEELKRYLVGYQFIYKGRILENSGLVVITAMTRINGKELRTFILPEGYIEADDRYELLGGTWEFKREFYG